MIYFDYSRVLQSAKLADMTLEHLSKVTGITHGRLKQMSRGALVPTAKDIALIANATGNDVEYYFPLSCDIPKGT